MRILLSLSLVMMLFSCQEKKPASYLISGNLPQYNDKYVLLMERNNGTWNHLDSALIQNDTFSLKGAAEQAEILYLSIKDEQALAKFVIENEQFQVKLDTTDNHNDLVVEGGTLNQELKLVQSYKKNEYDSLVNLITETRQNDSLNTEEKEEQLNTYYEDIDAYYTDYEKYLRQYIADHNASILAPYLVRSELYYSWEADQLDSVLQVFDTTLKDNIYVQQISERADLLRKVAVGKEAPSFTQQSPEGTPVSLDEFKGKYLLIDFWASWCGPCRRENPNVVATYEAYKDKNFEILGISLDENKDKWTQAIEKDHITWAQVSDLKGWNNEVAKLYAVNSIPHTVLVAPDGKIIAKNLRGEALKEKLEEVL